MKLHPTTIGLYPFVSFHPKVPKQLFTQTTRNQCLITTKHIFQTSLQCKGTYYLYILHSVNPYLTDTVVGFPCQFTLNHNYGHTEFQNNRIRGVFIHSEIFL